MTPLAVKIKLFEHQDACICRAGRLCAARGQRDMGDGTAMTGRHGYAGQGSVLARDGHRAFRNMLGTEVSGGAGGRGLLSSGQSDMNSLRHGGHALASGHAGPALTRTTREATGRGIHERDE